MDAKTAAYLRERRRHVGTWGVVPRVISGIIGAALGKSVPASSTPVESLLFAIVGAVGGVIVVETVRYAWRFIWVAPKTMYFEALASTATAERAADKRLRAVESAFEAKRQIYARNIEGLTEQVAGFQRQISDLEGRASAGVQPSTSALSRNPLEDEAARLAAARRARAVAGTWESAVGVCRADLDLLAGAVALLHAFGGTWGGNLGS